MIPLGSIVPGALVEDRWPADLVLADVNDVGEKIHFEVPQHNGRLDVWVIVSLRAAPDVDYSQPVGVRLSFDRMNPMKADVLPPEEAPADMPD